MELKEMKSKSDFLKFKSEAFKNSRSNAANFRTLESVEISEENYGETVLIKLRSQEGGIEVNSSVFYELSHKYRVKSALIVQESFSDAKTAIYWKSEEIEEFLALKSNEKLKTKASRILNEFIIDFLLTSVRNNHLGKSNFN